MIGNGILTDTGQQKSSSKTFSKKANMFDTLLKHTTSSSDLQSEIDRIAFYYNLNNIFLTTIVYANTNMSTHTHHGGFNR